MKITVYIGDSQIEHTDIDRVEERGSFLCIYEGDTIYRYNISHISHYVQSPEVDKDVQI